MSADQLRRKLAREAQQRAVGYEIAESLLDQAHSGEFDNHPTLAQPLRSVAERWYGETTEDVKAFLTPEDRSVLLDTIAEIRRTDPKALSAEETNWARSALREQTHIPSRSETQTAAEPPMEGTQVKLKRTERKPLVLSSSEPTGMPTARPPSPDPQQPAATKPGAPQETPMAQPATQNDWWESTQRFAASPELWTHLAAVAGGGIGGAALAHMLSNPAAIPASVEASPYGY